MCKMSFEINQRLFEILKVKENVNTVLLTINRISEEPVYTKVVISNLQYSG